MNTDKPTTQQMAVEEVLSMEHAAARIVDELSGHISDGRFWAAFQAQEKVLEVIKAQRAAATAEAEARIRELEGQVATLREKLIRVVELYDEGKIVPYGELFEAVDFDAFMTDIVHAYHNLTATAQAYNEAIRQEERERLKIGITSLIEACRNGLYDPVESTGQNRVNSLGGVLERLESLSKEKGEWL